MKDRKKNSSIKSRLKRLKKSATARNISVELNEFHYRSLLELGCCYCGENLMNEEGYCIDRHDNDRGYVFDNVSPCCKVCNRAKGSMCSEDFIDWVSKAFKFQKRKIEELSKIDIDERLFRKLNNQFKNKSQFKNSTTIKIEGMR